MSTPLKFEKTNFYLNLREELSPHIVIWGLELKFSYKIILK